MLVKELRVLYMNQQAAGRERQWTWLEHLKCQSLRPVTLSLQQDHTYPNKAILSMNLWELFSSNHRTLHVMAWGLLSNPGSLFYFSLYVLGVQWIQAHFLHCSSKSTTLTSHIRPLNAYTCSTGLTFYFKALIVRTKTTTFTQLLNTWNRQSQTSVCLWVTWITCLKWRTKDFTSTNWESLPTGLTGQLPHHSGFVLLCLGILGIRPLMLLWQLLCPLPSPQDMHPLQSFG